MAVVFQKEKLNDVLFELVPIIHEHWAETDEGHTKAKLNPDWGMYQVFEQKELLHIYTARDDGRLVGYISVVLQKGLHAKDYTYAVTDSIFLAKDHRGGTTAKTMIEFVEEKMIPIADIFNISMKAYAPFDSLLDSMGYKLTEKIFTKEFEEN